MKQLSLFLVLILFIACSQKSQQSEEFTSSELTLDTLTYSEYKISKIFYTLPDGTAKEDNLNIEFLYNNELVQVIFPDSTWTFDIINLENKTEGIVIHIKDKKLKKYKEIFIAAGELPIITFTTHTGTGNLTLM